MKDHNPNPLQTAPAPSTGALEPSSMLARMQYAKLLAQSDLVPDQYRAKSSKGKENPAAEANIMIAMDLCERTGLAPLGVMQGSYVIGGKLAFESKLALAMLEASGKIIGPPRYHWDNENRVMSCTVMDAATQSPVDHSLSWKSVVRNGWDKNPAWKNDPEMMLKYRSLMQLIRVSYPSVLLGFTSVDEAEHAATMDPEYMSMGDFYESRGDDTATKQIESKGQSFTDSLPELGEPTPEELAEIKGQS